MLVYTLKKHKQKLKMCGLGPYVINELTTGGAVRLETLEGEPMANFINGSCLKRFHEPLTQNMLEKMHAARTRKEALETMKQEAQEEARQRAAKAKARRHQIAMVQTHSKDEDDYVPPMLLPIEVNSGKGKCNALLDSGADVNVMAAHIYESFVDKELSSTTNQLNTVSNQSINCHGVATAIVFVQGHVEKCQFYITKSGESAHDVILGRSWMSRHRCQFNWEATSISVVFGQQQITVPAANVATTETSTSPWAPTSAKALSPNQAMHTCTRQGHTVHPHRKIPQKDIKRHQQLQYRNKYIWVPKNRQAGPTKIPQSQSVKTAPRPATCQQWIPKSWLEAQKFYQGNRYIWIPKLAKEKNFKHQIDKTPQEIRTHPPIVTSNWSTTKPKSIEPRQSLQSVTNISKEKLIKGKQIIKDLRSQAELESLQQAIISLPSTSLFPCGSDLQLQFSKLSIRQRARSIQCKLFGRSSLNLKSQVAVC